MHNWRQRQTHVYTHYCCFIPPANGTMSWECSRISTGSPQILRTVQYFDIWQIKLAQACMQFALPMLCAFCTLILLSALTCQPSLAVQSQAFLPSDILPLESRSALYWRLTGAVLGGGGGKVIGAVNAGMARPFLFGRRTKGNFVIKLKAKAGSSVQ